MYGREIGRGAYGTVYRSDLDPSKVTKAFREDSDNDVEQAFLTEVYIGHYLTACSNPYTPKLHKFSTKQHTITMDWAGKEISTVKWPSEATMYKAIRQFILAVASLGEAGLIHRDLKPQNVLWKEESEQLYIIDWGLGMVSGALLKDYKPSYVQTRWWRAPEVLLYDHTRSYSSKIDVWSMGIIILEILTGQTFEGMNKEEQLHHYFQVFGTPHDRGGLMTHSSFAVATRSIPFYSSSLTDLLKGVDAEIAGLLRTEILCLEPKTRISSEGLAKHPIVQSWAKDSNVVHPAHSLRPFSPTWPSKSTSITLRMFSIVFDWLLEVCLYFKADIRIFPLSCALIHRCLDAEPERDRSTLQRLACACLYLTSSFLCYPRLKAKDLVSVSLRAFTKEALLEEASKVLTLIPNLIEVQRGLPYSRVFDHQDFYDVPTFYLGALILLRDCIFRINHEAVDPQVALSLACHLLNPEVHPMPIHPFRPSKRPSLKALSTMSSSVKSSYLFTKKSLSGLDFERLKGLKSELVHDFFRS